MPTINYCPEKLTHERAKPFPRVAPFTAGALFLGAAGIQVVDAIVWSQTLKSPEFGERMQNYLERGVFVVVDDSDAPSLATRNPTEALSLVKDTFDVELLNAWAGDEARPTVLRAIEKQLKVLTPPEPKGS